MKGLRSKLAQRSPRRLFTENLGFEELVQLLLPEDASALQFSEQFQVVNPFATREETIREFTPSYAGTGTEKGRRQAQRRLYS